MSGRITAEEEAAIAQAAGGEWTCEICTCINARQRLQCEACESPIQQHEGCTSQQQAKEQLTFQPVSINQRTSSLGHPTKKRKLADRANNGLKYAKVIGIDWSGAQHAGNTISVAVCRVVRHQNIITLTVESICAGKQLPGSGKLREQALPALRNFLISQLPAATPLIVGLDSAMSVAECLTEGKSWQLYVEGFAERYPSAEHFRQHCKDMSGGKEPKRVCDVVSKTPFSPQNLRMYRQTYHAITGLVAPLLQKGCLCVPPLMVVPKEPSVCLLEVCPASLLKRWSNGQHYKAPYKGKTAEHKQARAAIVAAIEKGVLMGGKCETPGDEIVCVIEFEQTDSRRIVLADTGGDALDSLLAAVGAVCAMEHPVFPAPWTGWEDSYSKEGCVYT